MEMPQCSTKEAQLATEVSVSLKNLTSVVNGYGSSLNQTLRCICYVNDDSFCSVVEHAWNTVSQVNPDFH